MSKKDTKKKRLVTLKTSPDKANLILANKLKQDALTIMSNQDIWRVFAKYGKICLSGSAELDLLVYPDLDVYFDCYKKDINIIDIFSKTLSNVVKLDNVSSVKMAKELYKTDNRVPKGTYLQIKFRLNSRLWQIDIWHFANKSNFNKQLKYTEELKAKIDASPDKKMLILEAKHAIKRPDGSTPSYSGYYVYQAVFNHGLTDVNAIKKYVASCNIQPTKY